MKKCFIFLLLVTSLLFGCAENQRTEEQSKIIEKCLKELGNETDPNHKFLGVEKHHFEDKNIEMCCAIVIGENGTVKYCFEPVISKLSPVSYRNVVFWKLNNGTEVKILEGYEKEQKFFWKSYDEEDGKLTGMVEYYMKGKDLCAKIFDSEGDLVGDICE